MRTKDFSFSLVGENSSYRTSIRENAPDFDAYEARRPRMLGKMQEIFCVVIAIDTRSPAKREGGGGGFRPGGGGDGRVGMMCAYNTLASP